ncbi:MAG: hypothetical protein IKY98_00895, partial [Alphaproteobacteria bacterium]|nr:hypothetical protein [Alphaproteobacteria bacterium]
YYTAVRLNLLPLSWDNITAKYNGFIAGQWSMTTQGTILFLTGVILFFPLWYYGCVFLYKINWNFHLFHKHHEKVFQRKLVLNPSGASKLNIPMKLKLQNHGQMVQHPTSPSASAIPTPPAPIQRTPEVTSEALVQSNNDMQMPPEVDSAIKDGIEQLLNRYQVDVFKDIVLGNQIIPFAASFNETAYVITIIHEPDEFFIINTDDGIHGDWFTTRSVISAPALFIKKAAETLKAMESDSIIIPVIIVAGGQIDEIEELENILADHQITLVRYNQGGPDSIQTLEDYLDLTLEKKEDNAS